VPSVEDELGGLNSSQQRELRDCAKRLKQILLSSAAPVDLRLFLPPSDAPHQRAVLQELVKTELEARYAGGRGCLLEEFLRQYPELGSREDLPTGLLYQEYRARRISGDCPRLEEYRTRFPQQFEALRRMVEQDSPSSQTQANAATLPPPTAPPTKPPGDSGLRTLPVSEGYQLLQRIGQGQFGEVWRALAPGGVIVAVKRIYRSMDDECSQRELKALHKIREIRHPFLLQIHNFQALEDRLVIVMELADGSLEERLKECRAGGMTGIPADELLRYFSEAAEALDFLHEHKLSHRDIKPQNLLHLKGHAKVADFGIARPQENALDHTLNIGGTPAFMPPEMWRGDISVHSDQYSLALTWYEMRTGRRPISATNPLDLAQQHISGQPDLSGVPEPEQEVLLRALAKKPDQRFATCAAFVQALWEAMTPAKPEIPAPRRGLKVAIGLLACTLVTILITVCAVLWLRPPQRPSDQPEPPKVEAIWQPHGWEPEANTKDLVEDRNGHRYYRRLVHEVGGQKVVMLAVPQKAPDDPRTFYIMENKVWNGLYAVFIADPAAEKLLRNYSSRPGCDTLVQRNWRDEWRKGGYAPKINPDPSRGALSGVKDGDHLPVFRVTVTEAHAFAVWLSGLLPSKKQWRKAAGVGEDDRTGPFDSGDMAIGQKRGPWPVEKGIGDRSIYDCRQMASNGKEWTRGLADKAANEKAEIPLEEMIGIRKVVVQGQSYLSGEPLTFQALMQEPEVKDCTAADPEVTFRVVLER
jgi:serine/threonine protein kinase